MATHDKRLRKKEAKRSRLRRIADGEDVDDEDDEEFSDDSEDDDGTDRREEVRFIIGRIFIGRNLNGAVFEAVLDGYFARETCWATKWISCIEESIQGIL